MASLSSNTTHEAASMQKSAASAAQSASNTIDGSARGGSAAPSSKGASGAASVDSASASGVSWPAQMFEEDGQRPQHSSPGRPPTRQPRQRPRRQRPNAASRATPDRTPPPPTTPESLQDWITNSALSGTLELLKLAGGVTLSTTGKLVAPPLHVTRTVLLPAMYAAIADYISFMSPQRLKDWFRILSTSFYHIVTVVKNTRRGKAFRGRVVQVGSDIVDCLSSDTSRQVLMDGMSCVVRLSEALHTPEMKALLEQLSILGCRLVDAAASGRNKQLMHNWNACVWSALELCSDPSATLALAEVTAYLCHALEMEDAKQEQRFCQNPLEGQDRKQQQAQRRYERNQHQTSTYGTSRLSLQDPDATVEEVILSSLGTTTSLPTEEASLNKQTSAVPNVIWNQPDLGETAAKLSEWEPIPSVYPEDVSDGEEGSKEGEADKDDWREDARNEVDVAFLRERIAQRAGPLNKQHFQRSNTIVSSNTTPAVRKEAQGPTTIPLSRRQSLDESERQDEKGPSDDIEDLQVLKGAGNEANKMSRPVLKHEKGVGENEEQEIGTGEQRPVQDVLDPDFPQADRAYPLEGELPVDHFYRVLDEILDKKRAEVVSSTLGEIYGKGDDSRKTAYGKGIKWHPAAEGRTAGGRGQDTIKKRLLHIRSQLLADAGVTKEEAAVIEAVMNRNETRVAKMLEEHSVGVLLGLAMLCCVAFIWFAFGCYGIYRYFSSEPDGNVVTEPLVGAAEPLSPSSEAIPGQEIVIRVIREFVHVAADGTILQRASDSPLGEENIDKITECVTSSM